MKLPKRLRSYPLWIATLSLIGLFINRTGILAPGEYQQYVDALLAILVASGIITNPSIGKGYADKGEDKQ